MENRSIWAPLAEGKRPQLYRRGQLIYLQDTPAREFYYLIEGTARSYISSSSGEELVLTLHRAGDLMGEASFFDQCPRVSSALAASDCKVVSIDSQELEEIFRRHPELIMPMLRYLARTVRLLSAHVDGVAFRPAEQRLAAALLRLSGSDRVFYGSHEELGFAVGVSRVTVSRALDRFARKGWVETGYGKVRVLDDVSLRDLAEGEL